LQQSFNDYVPLLMATFTHAIYLLIQFNKMNQNNLAPYRTDGRLFTSDVCANFKVTRHKNYAKYQ